jgi:hypothetical protein
MTGSIESSVEGLAGWSIVGWSLTVPRLLVIELINFRGGAEAGRNCAKIIFVTPRRTSMKGFRMQPGGDRDIGVKSARLAGDNGEGIVFEMDGLGGGRAVIEAREIAIVFS